MATGALHLGVETAERGVGVGVRREVDAERAKVEVQINEKLAQAEKSIADTRAKALTSVGEISVDVATAIVGRLLGTEVSRAEVEKAVVQQAAE